MARKKQTVLSDHFCAASNEETKETNETTTTRIVPPAASPSLSIATAASSRSNISPHTEREKNDEHKRVANTSAPAKCTKCGTRQARKGCTKSACLACCTDEDCEAHRESREQAQWREKLLAGKTDIQLRAKAKRSKVINKGQFREKEFGYIGDTVIIWNIHEYMANPKWKDDALRKANRRNARVSGKANNSPKNKKKKTITKRRSNNPGGRFRRVMEDLYQSSLKN